MDLREKTNTQKKKDFPNKHSNEMSIRKILLFYFYFSLIWKLFLRRSYRVNINIGNISIFCCGFSCDLKHFHA